MKSIRPTTYRRITRAAYLLGIVFLLAGMMLSMVSQPAFASPSAKPTRGAGPIVRTPEGPQPSDEPTTPPHNPDNPGQPGNRVPGRNVQNFNFSDPSDALRAPLPPIRLMALDSGSVNFTQSNYCLSQPGSGWVDATAVVTIPEGETARLETNWFIVHPNPYPDNPSYNGNHYEGVDVVNGQRVTISAFWPGASLWNPSVPEYETIEIHWGVRLFNPANNQTLDITGLDAYFNGGCGTRPALSVSHQCVDGGGIQWTAHNPGTTTVFFGYSITDGTTGYSRVTAGGSTTFATTVGGAQTATISYDNGQGTLVEAYDASVAGECQALPALTVSHACGADGVVFTASNPNASPVTFTYTDGTVSGTATAPGGGSVDFLTLDRGAAHAVSIEWDNGVGGTGTAQDSSTADECGTLALEVSHQCKDGGGIVWNVYNPGTQTVAFTWVLDSDSTQTGSGSVGAGQTTTATETSGGAHRLDVSWTGGSTFDTSTIEECGGPPNASLEISRQCVVGGGIEWSVTNNGNIATSFTWTMDTDADSGSGSIGVGETIVVTTTTGGAHLLTVAWQGNSTSQQSGDQECGGQTSLAITYQCVVGGGIQWRVTNGGNTALGFSWNLDNGQQTGTGTAPAMGSTDVVVSAGGVHSLSIAWSGGSTSRSSDAEDCNPPQPVTLELKWQCSEDNTGVDWLVVNNNPVDVTFTWSLDGGEASTDTVGRNSSKIFHTVAGHDGHTMSISWTDEIGAYTLEDTNPGNVCVLPEEPKLSLTNRCVMEDRIEWTAKNPGNSDVVFEWDLDSGDQTGTDTAPANGQVAFVVTSNGRHVVTITWPENNSLTRTSSRDRCVPVVQTSTPPPGVTPSVTTTTTTTVTTTTTGTAVTATSSIPRTGGTPVPTVSAPGSATSGQGSAVSPVTGGDLNALSLSELVQRLLTNLGLLFLGVALVLTGFGSRLNR